MHRKFPKIVKGFTLIELMVTLAVFAIVMTIAIPSFNAQIRNNRSLTFGDEFATALNFARSEAVKRGSPVSLCAADEDQTGCGNDWANGWLVVVDSSEETGNSVTVEDADADVLRVWDPFGDEMALDVSRDNAVSFVRFTGRGGLPRNSVQPVLATAKHESCTGDSARSIRVGVSGSVRAVRVEC